MINKTKFSTITAVIATIAAIAALGSIGGGIGLGQQQQIALATLGGDDRDSSGTDSSIVPIPDVSWIAPEVSSRIPDISSIVPVPDTSFIVPLPDVTI